MKLKLPFLLILVFLFNLFSFNVFPQSPSKTLRQAEKALGGAKNLAGVRAQRKTGTITRFKDGASGRLVEQYAQPIFYNLSYDLNGFETETGYNGKSGWRRDSREGLQTLTGSESRDFSAEADFRNTLWLDYKKDKSKIASGGRVAIDGKAANIVVLTTAKGVSVKLYFDAATGLPVREEIPSGETKKTFDYEDYRAVGSVKIPFSIRLKEGENEYRVKLHDVKINSPAALTEFDFPVMSGEPLPDVRGLLQSLQGKADEVEKLLDTYSYNQKIISRELGKDGVLRETESETRQLSFYKGFRIARLIEKNGKPLSEKEQKKEDEEVQNRVAEIEKQIAKKEAKAAAQSSKAEDEENKRVSIAELLRASLLKNPRRERFRGRDVVVFDFEPNPSFDYENAKSFLKFFGRTAGVMWIDAEDKQVARIEAVLADSFNIGGGVLAKLRKGASFTLEQERVGDEIWLPSVADINLSVRVLLVKGIDLNQSIKSFNYRKFDTEVKDARIDEAKNP